jgi:hypothetical protein
VTVFKIMNLFSFNQYLFSDRTKLNLKKDYQALVILFCFNATPYVSLISIYLDQLTLLWKF